MSGLRSASRHTSPALTGELHQPHLFPFYLLPPTDSRGLRLLTVILPLDKGFPLPEPLHADTVDDTWRLLCLERLVQLGEQRTETCRRDLDQDEPLLLTVGQPCCSSEGGLIVLRPSSQPVPAQESRQETRLVSDLVCVQPRTCYHVPAAPPCAVSTGEPLINLLAMLQIMFWENRGKSFPLTDCDRSPSPTSCCCCEMLPVRTLMKVSISILLRLASASISTWQMEHTYRWFTAGPPPNLGTEMEGNEELQNGNVSQPQILQYCPGTMH